MNNLDILTNREEKKQIIDGYIKEYQVISLKANIPGNNKNLNVAHLLISYFDHWINEFKPINKITLDGADGRLIIYLFPLTTCLKPEMEKLENTPLGRFIDLDVYFNNDKSMNRKVLRTCYLCGKPAFVCGRNKNHSLDELLEYINQTSKVYFKGLIKEFLYESMMDELNLDDKFGLVTPTSNGSHPDMNYEIMKCSIDAIIDDLVTMWDIGYSFDDLKIVFAKIRELGKETEKKMFKASNGINTYKGLIFGLGIMAAGVGYKLNHIDGNQSVFDITRLMTKGITNELDVNSDSTFGFKAYRDYHILGARGEAEQGFPNVQKVLNDDFSDLHKVLIKLIISADDTVLLKRCHNDIELYNRVKKSFVNVPDYKLKTQECVKQGYSFGGSADLLIISIFVNKINQNILTNMKGEPSENK